MKRTRIQAITRLPVDNRVMACNMGTMRKSGAISLGEAFQFCLPDVPPAQLEEAKSRFVKFVGGSNIYVPKTDVAKVLERNMEIIQTLPSYGAYCSRSKVHELARKYDLSDSQIYRIRREAENTYAKLEELYDYGLISEELHAQYIAVLQKKLPGDVLGKSLK
ncbi:Mor transcription activator family protein [Candidatus Haliotispira prima]|uniref:Mor transcription activator family protein n=1 Tax=Candidatus Haliotispira prima TaxID=3034016 RepID=A0ABY8MHL0_9SPIO|nr:Mor transcription activator family protein [Candidatus Haliotispira prima]